MKQVKKANFDIVFVFGLFFLFAILALMIVGMGSQLYQRTLENVQSSYESQTSLSYITNKMRYLGTNDVSVEQTANGSMIYINETLGGERYHTIIYFYNGYLYEQFKPVADTFHIDGGTALMQLQYFDAYKQGDLIYLEVLTTTNKPETLRIALTGGGSA